MQGHTQAAQVAAPTLPPIAPNPQQNAMQTAGLAVAPGQQQPPPPPQGGALPSLVPTQPQVGMAQQMGVAGAVQPGFIQAPPVQMGGQNGFVAVPMQSQPGMAQQGVAGGGQAGFMQAQPVQMAGAMGGVGVGQPVFMQPQGGMPQQGGAAGVLPTYAVPAVPQLSQPLVDLTQTPQNKDDFYTHVDQLVTRLPDTQAKNMLLSILHTSKLILLLITRNIVNIYKFLAFFFT